MSYYISDRQVPASVKERRLYQPFRIAIPGCERIDETIEPGHPLYYSLTDVYTVQNNTEQAAVWPVLPTGCVSIVFSRRGNLCEGRLVGPIDAIRKVAVSPGERYMFLQFLPGTCGGFYEGSIASLAGLSADIEEQVRGGSRLLEICAREDINDSTKILLMSRFLNARTGEKESDYLLHFCTEEIVETRGMISIGDLAAKTGFSERYIGQLFERHVGLSPKMFSEIIRLQYSLPDVTGMRGAANTIGISNGWMMIFGEKKKATPPQPAAPSKEARRPLAEIAADNGYFDHAHMNRAYKRFLHCTAGALQKKGFSVIDFDQVPLFF